MFGLFIKKVMNEEAAKSFWKWFAEMEFGKPVAKQSTDEDKSESESIVFEGELEEWSR